MYIPNEYNTHIYIYIQIIFLIAYFVCIPIFYLEKTTTTTFIYIIFNIIY